MFLWQQYKNYKVLKAQHFYPRVPLIITGNLHTGKQESSQRKAIVHLEGHAGCLNKNGPFFGGRTWQMSGKNTLKKKGKLSCGEYREAEEKKNVVSVRGEFHSSPSLFTLWVSVSSCQHTGHILYLPLCLFHTNKENKPRTVLFLTPSSVLCCRRVRWLVSYGRCKWARIRLHWAMFTLCVRSVFMCKKGRIEGWTPGPEDQRRFEGQHQTLHQLINACRGDPDPARNNTNTSKRPPKAPILTVITLSHRKAVKSTHQPHRFELLPCLLCLTEPQRRTKATDWAG